jgi:RNA polymerase sigma factor (sigma-70 family)
MVMSSALNEKELIQKCINQDPVSQRLLYERYSGIMYAVCLRYSTDADHAKDLLQEGFIRVFGHLGSYKFEGSFEGWVRRIFVNTAIENYRRNQKGKYFEEYDDKHDRSVSPDAVSNLNMEELISLIQKLPDGYRTVFNLYVIEGYSHKEIAEELGITESTSKTQLRKARIVLMEKVNRH